MSASERPEGARLNSMENCGTIWSHKWMRIETIIGDPKQVKIKCVNCGAEVVHNLVTNEVK